MMSRMIDQQFDTHNTNCKEENGAYKNSKAAVITGLYLIQYHGLDT